MPEYLWYTLAAALAGVGTGLVGLSAATAMVPASDILGSAVTTATYIKHKNIDLKRGWITLAGAHLLHGTISSCCLRPRSGISL